MKDRDLELYRKIGNAVKTIRIEYGWSQDDLASRCSVNRAKISKIENAREDYMLSTLFEVCDALKTDLLEILKK